MVKLISTISDGAFAGTGRTDFSPVDHHTTHRELSAFERSPGQGQSLCHE
jgi:hypothetical protein